MTDAGRYVVTRARIADSTLVSDADVQTGSESATEKCSLLNQAPYMFTTPSTVHYRTGRSVCRTSNAWRDAVL